MSIISSKKVLEEEEGELTIKMITLVCGSQVAFHKYRPGLNKVTC